MADMKRTTIIGTAIAVLGLAACGSTVPPRVTPTPAATVTATGAIATPEPTSSLMPTPSPPPMPSPTHWWQANGNANDSVGTDNGTLVGVTFGPGVHGTDQAFSFSG